MSSVFVSEFILFLMSRSTQAKTLTEIVSLLVISLEHYNWTDSESEIYRQEIY